MAGAANAGWEGTPMLTVVAGNCLDDGISGKLLERPDDPQLADTVAEAA